MLCHIGVVYKRTFVHDSSAYYRGCIPRQCLLIILSLIGNLFWLAILLCDSVPSYMLVAGDTDTRTGTHIAHMGETKAPISYDRYPLLNPVKFLHIYIHTQFTSRATSNCSELATYHNKKLNTKRTYIHTYIPAYIAYMRIQGSEG